MTCYSTILSLQSPTVVETGSISVINQSFQDNNTNQIAEWITLTSSSLSIGAAVVRINGIWNTASIDDDYQAEALGIVEQIESGSAKIVYKGIIDFTGISGSSILLPGQIYYLGQSGSLTTTESYVSKPMYIATSEFTGLLVNMRGHVNSNQSIKTPLPRADIPCRPPIYFSTVTEIPCPMGTYGLPITIDQGMFSSSISIVDANNQAYAYLDTFTSSLCPPVYFSDILVIDCPSGAPVLTVSSSYGQFYSFSSSADANNLAEEYLMSILSSSCHNI